MRTRANALTVVDHLHVVTRASLADPVTARLAVDLSSRSLEDLLDMGPCSGRATGHERGTVTGTLLTTGHTGTDVADALGGEVLGAAVGVGVVGVATVDDDVALLEVGDKLLDELVYGITGLDEEDDFTWALELCAKLFDGPRSLDLGTWKETV